MNKRDVLARLKSDSNKDLMLITDGQKFIEALEAKVKALAQTLDQGMDINGVDTLLIQLEQVNAIQPAVIDLKKAIEAIDIEVPDKVEVKGLESLLKAIRQINKAEVNVDLKPLDNITVKLDALTKAVNDNKVDQGQKPTDFIPVRRVMLIGKSLVFDDMHWSGGGGGGGGVAPPSMLYQPISQGGAGTTNIAGAVSGKRIKVTNYAVVLGGAGTVQFKSDANNITGAMSFGANGGVSVGGTEFSPAFQTGVGEALNIVTTGAAGNGHIAYFFE